MPFLLYSRHPHLLVSPIPRLMYAPSAAEVVEAIAARSGRTRGHRA